MGVIFERHKTRDRVNQGLHSVHLSQCALHRASITGMTVRETTKTVLRTSNIELRT
jgi:hypothetical protein